MAYSSVIFDMDGVLLNSLVDEEEWKYNAVGHALEERDVDPDKVSREEMNSLLGDEGYKSCLKTSSNLGLDPRKMWSLVAQETTTARRKELEKGNFQLYPSVKETIEKLHEQDIQMAVISNAPESAVKMLIDYFDLKEYFEFYAGVRNFEDLQAQKPHPNHLELAKAELKRDPFVYVGDSNSDLEAADNAHVDSVWVKRGENKAQENHEFEVEHLSEIVENVVEDRSE